MSQVSANTPKRQAIVDRLKQRIDSFRKHHDDCQTRLEKTQPSRELKQRQESQILHTKFMENIKVKTNTKLRHDQVNSKITKQESGQDKSASSNNTGGLQSTMKRRNEFSPPHMDGERTIQTGEDLGPPLPPKYSRFEGRNGVHCKIKPNFNASDSGGDALQAAGHSGLSYSTTAVNGHNATSSVATAEFQTKSEEPTTITVSSYSNSPCEGIERTTTRAGQPFPEEFASTTFPNRGQASENSRPSDFSVNFKKENKTGLVSATTNEEASGHSTSALPNGFQDTKSADNFDRLLTDYSNPKSEDDDLKSQISEFERVFQVIKNQDRSSSCSDCETSNENTTSSSSLLKNAALASQNAPLGNGLNDSVSHDVGKGSNQLALSNEANNGPQLAAASSGPVSLHHQQQQQQHGTISRATAQAVHQFIRTQQEERMTKVRYEKNYLLNSQGVPTPDQNTPRLPPRPNHSLAAIRQRMYEQIQSRRTNQQKSKMHGLRSPAQLQARNPVMSVMQAGAPYSMHPGYPNFGPNGSQPVPSFSTTGRVQQNMMAAHLQNNPTTNLAQPPHGAQMQGMPRHQLNVYAQQQKMAYQQQMASRLPSYSQPQHRAESSPMMDIRQKLSAEGTYTSSSGQYPLQPQATRAPQPLSHLPHYPNTYPNPSAGTVSTTRPMQTSYGSGEYPVYQNPYGYNMNQDNKLHTAYQRHSSMDESMTANRYHNQEMNNRTNFNYQRSSSLPGHGGAQKNVFNQTSPPVVRLGHNKLPPDMNNNGNEHPGQELGHVHTTSQHAPLTHKKHPTNNLTMSQDHVYQGNNLLAQTRPVQTTTENLQQTFSNSFTNLLDLKSNSESSLFPFLGQDVCATSTENTDFDSLLKSPPADFNLLNILESEPKKAL